MDLCFATNNLHKLAEVAALISPDINLVSLRDIGCEEDIPENRDTIQDNSRAKAEFVFKKYQIDCFADDTGLEVDALNGEPGVRSARYAGPDKNSVENVKLLLHNLGMSHYFHQQ